MGGQLTASAVCAVDWPNIGDPKKKEEKAALAAFGMRDGNVTPALKNIVSGLPSGGAWVSGTTFAPNLMVDKLVNEIKLHPNLRVHYETVIKEATGAGDKIKSVKALKAKSPRAYRDRPHRDIPTWYDPATTVECLFKAKDEHLIVIDASEWGELLVLARAKYAVGVELHEKDPYSCQEKLGAALGTALGDYLADGAGLGFEGGALVFAAALALVAAAYFFTTVSRATLFWLAFILTRPLGATVGDLLDKPVAAGGFNLSRITASVVLGLFIIAMVAFTQQRAGGHPGEQEQGS